MHHELSSINCPACKTGYPFPCSEANCPGLVHANKESIVLPHCYVCKKIKKRAEEIVDDDIDPSAMADAGNSFWQRFFD
jgi:hypothetical protein